MKTNVVELRTPKGSLVGLYYPDIGVIECIVNKHLLQIIVPPGTQIEHVSYDSKPPA